MNTKKTPQWARDAAKAINAEFEVTLDGEVDGTVVDALAILIAHYAPIQDGATLAAYSLARIRNDDLAAENETRKRMLVSAAAVLAMIVDNDRPVEQYKEIADNERRAIRQYFRWEHGTINQECPTWAVKAATWFLEYHFPGLTTKHDSSFAIKKHAEQLMSFFWESDAKA